MATDFLSIALVQSNPYWEDRIANLAYHEELLSTIEQSVDFIVLPEMFTTGSSMNASLLAEPMKLHTFRWMYQQAQKFNASIIGSYIVTEQGQFYNRLVIVNPFGEINYYDKKHLFPISFENEHFTAGEERLIYSKDGWNVCPLICYDLRFPVWSRNTKLNYEVLIYIANWPSKRDEQWETLLKARAIENQAYCIGINRVGKDGNEIDYCGNSLLINFDGTILTRLTSKEEVSIISLSKNQLTEYRTKFPVWKSADSFQLHK